MTRHGALDSLRRRVFRTQRFARAIPPDARVDPARFPEGEFPVVCTRCGYLLSGLTESRCPECGAGFDRGRLLVQEYLLEAGSRFQPRRLRAIVRLATTATLVFLGFLFAGAAFTCAAAPWFAAWNLPRSIAWFEWLHPVVSCAGVAVCLLLVVATVISAHLNLAAAREARRVRDALGCGSETAVDQSEPRP